MKQILCNNAIIFLALSLTLLSCHKTKPITASDTPQFFSISQEEEFSQLTIFDSSKSPIQTIKINSEGPVGSPIKKLGIYSTTYHPMIEALNQLNKVVVIDTVKYSNNQKIINRVKTGEILETGPFPTLDFETLLLSKADAIFIPPFSLTPTIKEKLKTANIRYYVFNEWQENSPLAKSAWVKVAALLLGQKELGDEIYNKIESQYLDLKNEIASNQMGSRPLVLTSYPYQEQWGVCTTNSYLATLIYDAGGMAIPFEKRLKKSTSGATLLLSCETVLLHGHDCQIWLINSDPNLTKEKIAKQYPLLQELKAYKTGSIFNNSKRVNQYGGNDYFEQGAFYPHLLLQDIHKIISDYNNGTKTNPDEFYFYQQID